MHAVTGATGKLGRLVIASLLRRMGASQVVALARDPAKAADIQALGVEVRAFDYDAPGAMPAGLEGVTRLLLISSNQHDRRVAQHRAVLNAAAEARVQLFSYTSIIHADSNPLPLAQSHRETEGDIVASGLTYALLRNSWYIENYLLGATDAMRDGELLGSSGDGRSSAATRADYAEGAAAVLAGSAEASRTYELAGDEAFSLTDVAAVLSEAAGRPVRYRDLPEADYRDALAAAGTPAVFAATLAQYSKLATDSVLADSSRALSGLLGRPTETMRDALLEVLRAPVAPP